MARRKSSYKPVFKNISLVKAFILASSLALVVVLTNAVTSNSSLSSAEAAGISPLGQTGNWDLIFSDEFDGNSLNLSKWEPSWFAGNNISKPVNAEEDGCYDPAQVSVRDGKLLLSAVETTKPGCTNRSGQPARYASGLVNTRNSFTYTYGYIEARMYTPGSNGNMWNWPAFWSNGTGKWPQTGEIDVMEGLASRKPCWHYHYQNQNGEHVDQGGCVTWPDGTGWHTYAAHWEPGRVTYYYDGKQVATITEGVVNAKHYIILNNGINDRFGINVPATVEVDYVRVWQRGASPTPMSSPSPTPRPTQTSAPTPRPTATPTPVPTAASQTLSVGNFYLSPSDNITTRRNVRATATLYAPTPIKVETLTIAVRNTRNRNYDFRGAVNNVTIGPNGYTFSPDRRTFPQGEYTAFVAYKLGGKWYNLAPQITFRSRR